MNTSEIQTWVAGNMISAISLAVLIGVILFLFTRNIIGRGLTQLASHTKTKIDDVLVKHLRPVRISWLGPLAVLYAFAYLVPDYTVTIRKIALFLVLWLAVLTINSLLNALNEIYESRPSFTGVSIQSYLDIAKILIVIVAIILSVSLLSGESPIVLLTGLGALTAVLLLIFQNTILSLVASVQIAAHDLIKEGDWIEVPSYDADGDVVNISLHTIKIQNWDMTFSVIPTYKIVDVAFKNWRGMTQSGGRRIQRSILIDMNSIRMCKDDILTQLCKIDLIREYLETRLKSIQAYHQEDPEKYDSPLDGPQITNIEVFRVYISAYLKNRVDIHQTGMPFLVRTLAPSANGLPVEVYIFARTTKWEEYEAIQSEIFDHLIAAAGEFGLRVFQQPTGMDFAAYAQGLGAG
jgi:miniconductance mechanosensitive channel